MREAPHSVRAKIERARMRPRIFHQLFQGRAWYLRGIDGNIQGRPVDGSNSRQVFAYVKWRVRHRRADGPRVRQIDQSVAIGRLRHDMLYRNDPSAAWPWINDELLAELGPHGFDQPADRGVRASAGRERNDKPYWLVGIALRQDR